MPAIYWSAFRWEAFATLATGVLAVGAAVYVGRRQSKIMSEQIAIARRQVDLEELKLRSDLYERRLAVYDAASRSVAYILVHDFYPDPEDESRFQAVMHQSRLLFRVDVYSKLKALYQSALAYRAAKKTGDQAVEDKHKDILKTGYEGFPDLFGDEMRLGAIAPSSETAA